MTTDTSPYCSAPALTLESIRHRATINVEEAGALFGLGRSGAYSAAARGDIPTIRVGRLLRVPVPTLLRLLGDDPDRLQRAETA